MLAKKCFVVGIFTLLSLSLTISAQPVHPATGEPLMMDCLRGTPDAIDGDLSDWNLEAMVPATLNAVEQLSSGQDIWTGPEDCSAEFYMLWDDVNIYMAVVVKDEKLAMNKTDADIWNSDCVEIFFATTDAIADHPWSNPTIHYQYGFNANNQTWNWCNMDGPGQSVPGYLQAASSITADGYICEVSIEYGQMLSLDFSAGNIIGLHPCIDDTDIDDGNTEYQMSWTGLAAHDQSLGFGHMLLSAESVAEPEPVPVDPGADGLVAHYAFENDLTDSSGNALDGVAVGDPVFVEGVEGMALDFNGDDYVDCGGNAEFSFTDAMTLSVWINWRATGATWQTVIAKGDNAWRLARGADTQTMDFGFTAGGDRGWQAARTVSEVPLSEWHHVTATYDTTDGAKIYLDGVLEGTNPDAAGITVGDYPVFIGDNSQQTGRFWDGLIDEVMIYNRVLSEEEILFLAGQ